jgi:hypothetical protein
MARITVWAVDRQSCVQDGADTFLIGDAAR